MEGGQPKFSQGHPEILGIYMRAKDCRVLDTWTVLGMHATDSNDMEAKDVFVPDDRLFALAPSYSGSPFQGATLPGSCRLRKYRVPPCPDHHRCCTNAINELKDLASRKTPLGSMVTLRERGVMQRKLGRAEALVQSSRAYLHEKIAQCWKKTTAGESISLEEKAGLLLAATYTNQSCLLKQLS